MAPRAAAVSTHHQRRAAAYRDFVTAHGRHPRLVVDSAAEASLARWLVRLKADGEANELVASVEGLIVPAQAQRTTEESVTVACVRFGYTHLRVPSRPAKDARERMLASWSADVVADPTHRDHQVLSRLAERITNRRHEVALVQMLEHKVATGKVVNNRSDAALYGALRRAKAARADGTLSVLGARLLGDLEGVPRPVRAPGRLASQTGAQGRALAGV
ncbi:hypothetical protein ACT4S5_13075 [Kocuria oceani]|uniref:hypothetical protein n=1 Tax=Kocuria oceani TaxID=988827 RepID=UPI00403686B1